jgi:hypothetical protein
MTHLHLFEFQDLRWVPRWMRNLLTDYLRYASQVVQVYRPAATILRSVIQTTGMRHIINLCSGGGGGLINLIPELNSSVKITLTDACPNLDTFERLSQQYPTVSYIPEAIAAQHVPENLKGVRTLFTSFHHFTPTEANQILLDAANSRSPICVFEATDRSIAVLMAVLMIPIFSLCAAPLVKPFKWSRLIFTYLIPLIPIFLLWDGLVSVVRSYTLNDLSRMVHKIPGMEWEVGHLHASKRVRLTYLVGLPV